MKRDFEVDAQRRASAARRASEAYRDDDPASEPNEAARRPPQADTRRTISNGRVTSSAPPILGLGVPPPYGSPCNILSTFLLTLLPQKRHSYRGTRHSPNGAGATHWCTEFCEYTPFVHESSQWFILWKDGKCAMCRKFRVLGHALGPMASPLPFLRSGRSGRG